VSGAPGAGDTERGMASGVADILEAVLAGHPHLRDNDQLALDIKHIRLIVALLRRLAAAPAPDRDVQEAMREAREWLGGKSRAPDGLGDDEYTLGLLNNLVNAVLASGRAGEDGR